MTLQKEKNEAMKYYKCHPLKKLLKSVVVALVNSHCFKTVKCSLGLYPVTHSLIIHVRQTYYLIHFYADDTTLNFSMLFCSLTLQEVNGSDKECPTSDLT